MHRRGAPVSLIALAVVLLSGAVVVAQDATPAARPCLGPLPRMPFVLGLVPRNAPLPHRFRPPAFASRPSGLADWP